MLTEEQIKQALQRVKYPGYSRDIVSFGLVKNIGVAGDEVSVSIELTSGTDELARQIRTDAERVLRELPEVKAARVEVKLPATGGAARNPSSQQTRVGGIKHVVAVASGKGGVGKSTTSVNLTCALTHLGAATA